MRRKTAYLSLRCLLLIIAYSNRMRKSGVLSHLTWLTKLANNKPHFKYIKEQCFAKTNKKTTTHFGYVCQLASKSNWGNISKTLALRFKPNKLFNIDFLPGVVMLCFVTYIRMIQTLWAFQSLSKKDQHNCSVQISAIPHINGHFFSHACALSERIEGAHTGLISTLNFLISM